MLTRASPGIRCSWPDLMATPAGSTPRRSRGGRHQPDHAEPRGGSIVRPPTGEPSASCSSARTSHSRPRCRRWRIPTSSPRTVWRPRRSRRAAWWRCTMPARCRSPGSWPSMPTWATAAIALAGRLALGAAHPGEPDGAGAERSRRFAARRAPAGGGRSRRACASRISSSSPTAPSAAAARRSPIRMPTTRRPSACPA